MAVLGHKVDEICGEGFTYSPKGDACYISTATSMYNADAILDEYVCSAHSRITDVEEDVDCLFQELNITQENVIGLVIPPCGLNADGTPYHYQPNVNACLISGATNMIEADEILDRAVCEMGSNIGCTTEELKRVEDVLGVHGNCSQAISYPSSQGCLLAGATTFGCV